MYLFYVVVLYWAKLVSSPGFSCRKSARHQTGLKITPVERWMNPFMWSAATYPRHGKIEITGVSFNCAVRLPYDLDPLVIEGNFLCDICGFFLGMCCSGAESRTNTVQRLPQFSGTIIVWYFRVVSYVEWLTILEKDNQNHWRHKIKICLMIKKTYVSCLATLWQGF